MSIISKKRKKTSKDVIVPVAEEINLFCEETSAHGFQYLAKNETTGIFVIQKICCMKLPKHEGSHRLLVTQIFIR